MASPGARRGPAAWAAALLLGVLLALAFRGALSGRLFYLRDVSQNHAPMRAVVTERLLQGHLPLWDPLQGGGTPLLANPDHLVLHPITALFLALPFDRAFTASIVLQYVLLALGGWLLARAFLLEPPGAFLCAAVMTLSGPAASLASQQNVLSAFAWLPIALWGFARAASDGSRAAKTTALLAAAVILMTGEVATCSALILFAPIVVWAAPRATAEGVRGGQLLKVTAPALLLAGLLASVQILPARALLAASSRAGGLPPAEALRWSLRPARLVETLLPRWFGDPTHLSPGIWWGGFSFEGGYPFLPSIVLGCGVMVLALAALGAGPARRLAAMLAIAGALFAALALGPATPILPLLRGLAPMAAQVRYPERFLLGAVPAVALLAAIGLERLMRRRGAGRAAALGVAVTVVIFVAATILVAAPRLADAPLTAMLRLPAGFTASEIMPEVRGGLARSLLWALVDAALFSGLLIAMRRGALKPVAAAWAIAATAALSLTIASDPARTTAAPGWLHAPSPLRETLADAGPGARLHHAPRPADLQVWARSDEQIWGFRFDRFSYALLTGHPDGVATIFDPATDRMDLGVSTAIGARLPGLPVDERARLLRLLGVGWYAAWEPVESANLEPAVVLEELSRPPMRLYRVRDPLPRFRLAARALPPADPGDPIRSLLDPEWDPRDTVLIDRPGEAAPMLTGGAPAGTPGAGTAAGDAAAPGRLEVLQDDPERVRISVSAPAPAMLVVGDTYAAGWRAFLDGRPASLDRANLIFRAVAVPAGRHEVTMEYRPGSLLAGAALSLGGLLLSAVWIVGWSRPA